MRDELGNEQGIVRVRLEIHDVAKFAYDNTFAGSNKILNTNQI